MPAILGLLGFIVGVCGGFAYWFVRRRNTQRQGDALPGQRVRTGEKPTLVAAAIGLVLALASVAIAAAQPASIPATTASTVPAPIAQPQPVPATETAEAPVPTAITARPATVTNVVDGDTADVMFADGTTERVRFIGVDTPESTTEHEPYGEQASAYTKARLSNVAVLIETDVGTRDQYGRLLAYIWLSMPADLSDAEIRTKMFNAKLAIDGYAQQMTIQPNAKYAGYFTKYVTEARDASRGLWDPALVAPVVQAPAPAPAPAPTEPAVSYIGNRNTHKFHYSDCGSVGQMNPSNKVALSSREAAISAGYVPCKNCDP